MSQLLFTLLVAFALIAIGLLAMAIGYFFNKKKCLRKQCGMNPNEKSPSECELCKGKDKEKNDDDSPTP
jgi:hypothetical protein